MESLFSAAIVEIDIRDLHANLHDEKNMRYNNSKGSDDSNDY